MIHGTSKYPLTVQMDAIKVDGGRCTSKLLKEGSIDDCLKVVGINGNIGYCRSCMHYMPDNPGVVFGFYDDKAAKRQVDADCRFLIRMIELVRKDIGHTEDIGTALLRLQHSADHYSKCLWEKYSEGGESIGKAKKNRDR